MNQPGGEIANSQSWLKVGGTTLGICEFLDIEISLGGEFLMVEKETSSFSTLIIYVCSFKHDTWHTVDAQYILNKVFVDLISM